jgi:hypothetical protein
VAIVLILLRHMLPIHVYDPVAGVCIQLLWFLGAYVLMLATIPLLYRISTRTRLAIATAGLYGLAAMIDAVWLHWSSTAPLGYLNMAVWLIPGLFGVAYRRGSIAPRTAFVTGVVMLGINVSLVWLGPYDVSLRGFRDSAWRTWLRRRC